MFGGESMSGASLVGTLIALGPPLGSAINWTVLQFVARGKIGAHRQEHGDMLPAVLIGAVLSALVTCHVAARRLGATCPAGTARRCAGVSLPARRAPDPRPAGPEIALLGLLEVLLGVTWAWLGAGRAAFGDNAWRRRAGDRRADRQRTAGRCGAGAGGLNYAAEALRECSRGALWARGRHRIRRP